MSRRQAPTLEGVWADRLGVVTTQGVCNELAAHFESLSGFVLGGEMPPAGTAEAATAYGDLCVLFGFLADVRRAFEGQEVGR
jgi:hypothetical protein